MFMACAACATVDVEQQHFDILREHCMGCWNYSFSSQANSFRFSLVCLCSRVGSEAYGYDSGAAGAGVLSGAPANRPVDAEHQPGPAGGCDVTGARE